MASSRPSQSLQSRRTQSTKATSVSATGSRKSSAYNKDFEQHLIEHNVYPEGYEHPDGRPTPKPNKPRRDSPATFAEQAIPFAIPVSRVGI